MSPPGSTYRLQLGPGFGFREAAAVAPYLADLGVGHVYLSPVFAARPGSEHGYDVVDPRTLSPELGGEAGFAHLETAVRDAGLGLVLDVVPNHLAIGEHNPFWWDVLEHGPSSPYADFFDIAWERGGALLAAVAPELLAPGGPEGTTRGDGPGKADGPGSPAEQPGPCPRLLLPVLGEGPAVAIREGAFAVRATPRGLRLAYRDAQTFPLEPRSWLRVLDAAPGVAASASGGPAPGASPPGASPPGAPRPDGGAPGALAALRESLEALPPFTSTDPDRVGVRRSLVEGARETLAAALEADAASIERTCAAFGAGGGPGAARRLRALLAAQPYALVHWQTADEHVNYRRFFEINDLAAVRAERPEVFDETHALVLRLVRDGRVDGLRVDHVDGLWDPRAYLERLRAATSPQGAAPDVPGGDARPWIVVEKILAPHERLPPDWPVQGTTGYDFLGAVQGLFAHPAGLRRLEAAWRELSGRDEPFGALARERKRRALREQFGGEVAWLAAELERLAGRAAAAEEVDGGGAGRGDAAAAGAEPPLPAPTRDEFASALVEASAGLRVYRTYVRDLRPSRVDLARLEEAVDAAREAGAPEGALAWLRRVLRLEAPPEGQTADWLRWVLRWQQLTGPAAAKGVEDTALYVDRRLLALNEVGAEPDDVRGPEAVHAFLARRAREHPATMSATSTHDTKRSEDVRARLLVLSDLAEEWNGAVARWRSWNRELREGGTAPTAEDELLLYQTLVGAWPLDPAEEPDFLDRLDRYLRKALREAKERSDWRQPDEAYEEALTRFARRILERGTPFRSDFLEFQERLAPFGALNSLAQLAVQAVAPGVPDRYRGTELWDFSLVDPDNRRPVDWALRRRALRELDRRLREEGRAELCRALAEDWRDGRIKLLATARALRWRRRRARLLARGRYVALEVAGPRAEHAFAFARRRRDRWAAVVVPRGLARLPEPARAGEGSRGAAGGWRGLLPPEGVWGDTRVLLPAGAPRSWLELFSGHQVDAGGGGGSPGPPALPLRLCLADFPVALLEPRR